MKTIMLLMGTRPETIKMAPIYHALRSHETMRPYVCSTGQHRDMLEQMMGVFDIEPDHDLDVMVEGQDLFDVTTRVLLGMRDILKQVQPDLLLVQGDTTSVMAAALAAFYLDIPIGHVEAGLRTWNIRNPFPEEMNRRVASIVSGLHFAPTSRAEEALRSSGVAEDHIFVTGNTVVDALFYVLDKLKGEACSEVDTSRMEQMILLTTHRRESFGDAIRDTFRAIRVLVEKYPALHVVYPAHPNPNVQEAISDTLYGQDRVHILPPVSYTEFVKLMRDCDLILTDSGGVQEEAPSLGKPVLVLRDTTERPEGIEAGTATLVGTNPDKIVQEVSRLLDAPDDVAISVSVSNPYGDGTAARKIVNIIEDIV